MDIFVTGLGVVSAIGNNCVQTLDSLLKSKSGVSKICYLNTSLDFPVGEVKLNNQQLIENLGLKCNNYLPRTALLGLMAAREAIHNAALPVDNSLRIGFISGTTVGGMDIMEANYDDFVSNNEKSDLLFPHDIGDVSEFIADNFGIFSFVDSISTACSSAANAIILGAELIKNNRCDIVVAGGCESLSKYHLNGFNTLKILDNEVCKPFDENRNGLNLGEGAGYIVLESSDLLKKYSRQPLCKLAGYGNACDAYHQTATSENGNGPYLAMNKALHSAYLKYRDIDYINAHGTGTPNNDLTEGIALQRVFGSEMPSFSSTKAFTGHTTSAAGGVEAVISVLCLLHDFVPANLNFNNPIKEHLFMPEKQLVHKELYNVMTNSFGFGGNDSSLIFSKI